MFASRGVNDSLLGLTWLFAVRIRTRLRDARDSVRLRSLVQVASMLVEVRSFLGIWLLLLVHHRISAKLGTLPSRTQIL